MRVLLKVTVPVEAGNKGIKDGVLPKTIMSFVEQHKPEAAYFLPEGGKRTALFVFDLKDASTIPTIGEPFFQNLNAEVTLSPVMNAEDLKAGLEKLAKQH